MQHNQPAKLKVNYEIYFTTALKHSPFRCDRSSAVLSFCMPRSEQEEDSVRFRAAEKEAQDQDHIRARVLIDREGQCSKSSHERLLFDNARRS